MVVRGLRKKFNDDIEAQKLSVEASNHRHQVELDKERFRKSVAWYHAASGWWLEVEVSFWGREVTFNSYPEIPTRRILQYSIQSKETNEHHIVEVGFVADGLIHAVWVEGGKWVYDKDYKRYLYLEPGRSKVRLHQQLITNISRLPQLFWELYQVRISIPMIQEAFKKYQDSGSSR